MTKKRSKMRYVDRKRSLNHSFLVSHLLGLRRIISDLEAENAKLKEEMKALEDQVCTDALTGLNNRRAIPYILGRKGALAIGDVDKFKIINDNHGHSTGDRVLIEIGKAIQMHCRHTDMVIRYGGDEFFIFLENCTQEDAEKRLNEIRESLVEIGKKYGLTNLSMSFGITEHNPLDSLEKTVELADQILRENKQDPDNPRNLSQTNFLQRGSSLELKKPK